MAHQPLGGRPVAVVSPNANHAGPLEDPTVSLVLRKSLQIAMLFPSEKLEFQEKGAPNSSSTTDTNYLELRTYYV